MARNVPNTARQNEFLSCREAGAAVRLSEISIRRMLTQGRLTRYKIGGRTLVSSIELFSLIRKDDERTA